ncbi:MAG: hypothetical protein LBB89_10260 [Treponema sp.]|jgi:hypothetical protein|nr:hypothetical protein [Treponema sp.]
MKKHCAVVSVCFISFFCLLSCGLEAFYEIGNIPNSEMRDVTRATIWLPSSSDSGYQYLTHFMIFYRIYISDVPETALIASTTTNDIYNRSLSTALNADFASLYPSTDKTSTSVNTSNLENIFYRRSYFLLTLEGASINGVLDSGGEKKLEILFSTVNGESPKLIINETSEYILQRAINGPGLNFTPKPDRRFFNHPDLYNPANITPQLNADVASNTGTDIRFTYVSMYIAGKGKSLELPPKDIYSQPTFIGVFRLANLEN